jgi:L,D-transpeptidase catalytic domain
MTSRQTEASAGWVEFYRSISCEKISFVKNKISDKRVTMMSTMFSFLKIPFAQTQCITCKNSLSSLGWIRFFPFFVVLLLTACSEIQAEEAHAALQGPIIKADRILVDKSDRVMILYKQDIEIARYTNIKLGDAPVGHKRFEGDEKTPEGQYTINGRNPASSYHLSLRVSYPNAQDRAYARSKGKSPGGDIFIHGQPNGSPIKRLQNDWTDGCIALSNAEIKLLWKQVDNGTPILIKP